MALGARLLSFISPCVLPLFPAYFSFITGMSATDIRNATTLRQHRARIMLHALCFIAGFSLVFIALGASLFQTHCAQCHALPSPKSHTSAHWEQAFNRMFARRWFCLSKANAS